MAMSPCISVELIAEEVCCILMLVKKDFYLTHLTVSSLFSSLGVLKAVENVNKVIGPALIEKVSRG